MSNKVSKSSKPVNRKDGRNTIKYQQDTLKPEVKEPELLECYEDTENPFNGAVGEVQELVFSDVKALQKAYIKKIEVPGIYQKGFHKQRISTLIRNFDIFMVSKDSQFSGFFDGGVGCSLSKGSALTSNIQPPEDSNTPESTTKKQRVKKKITIGLDTEYVEMPDMRDAEGNLKASIKALETKQSKAKSLKEKAANRITDKYMKRVHNVDQNTVKGVKVEKGKEYQTNKILSYQLWCTEDDCGLFIIAKNDKRLQWGEMLSIAAEVWRSGNITIWAHYNLAEVSAFDGFRKLMKKEVSRGERIVKNIHDSIIVNGGSYSYYDTHKHEHKISWKLKDTQPIITSGLDAVGKAVGIPKIDNPDIERMDWLLANKPKFFFIYSMMDAIIVTRFIRDAFKPIIKKLKLNPAPNTGSQLGASYAIGELNKQFAPPSAYNKKGEVQGVNHWRPLFGYREVDCGYVYDEKLGKMINVTKWAQRPDITGQTSAYHGGRNETYVHGIILSDCYDWDFPNAYPMAMVTIPEIDWDRTIHISNDNAHTLRYNDVGAIKVEYVIKKDVLYPPFASKAMSSLIFARRGHEWVNPVEFITAFNNGWLEYFNITASAVWRAKERVGDSVSAQPYNPQKIFGKLLKTAIDNRNEAKKEGSPLDLMWKLSVNGLYGKITQGINDDKTSFDLIGSIQNEKSDTERKTVMPKGELFNPVFAAHITATIRALATEYMNKLNSLGVVIVNCTTDGFQTLGDIPHELQYGKDMWLGSILSDNRKEVLKDDGRILELKHFNPYVVSKSFTLAIKTRCYVGYDADYFAGKKYKGIPVNLLVARGGQSTRHIPMGEMQDFLFKSYLDANKHPMKRYSKSSLSSVLDFYMGLDLHMKKRDALQNFDYDVIKRAVNWDSLSDVVISYKTLDGQDMTVNKAYFTTTPHENVSIAVQHKAAYEEWDREVDGVKVSKNKIQTYDHLIEFREYVETKLYSDTKVVSGDKIEKAARWKVIAFARKNDVTWGDVYKMFPNENKNTLNSLKASSTWKAYMNDEYSIIKVPEISAPGIYESLIEKIQLLPSNLIIKASQELILMHS